MLVVLPVCGDSSVVVVIVVIVSLSSAPLHRHYPPPQLSPGNTGVTRLWMNVGGRGARAEGCYDLARR